MIRRGKAEGWLQLPPDALLPWALLNDVSFDRTVPGFVQGRGGALLAKEDLNADEDMSHVLLTVPRDLVLSLERIQEHAKVDKDFREVLESLGDFGRTPRGAILSFLLEQSTVSCPDLPNRVGVHSPFTDYIKSLPMELLPTCWSLDELQLLVGTTLAPAMSAKLKSLRREYDLLCSSAAHTRWYETVQEVVDFDDWIQVDAMYRSRALELPGVGHCMVPCVDLANHASGEATIAVFEKDGNGNAILLLRDSKHVQVGGEVTITYGDEKGACEMLFSYGFLETSGAGYMTDSAGTLFLSLTIPEDDRCRTGKLNISDSAPGFKLVDNGEGGIDWTGDFVWLLCVYEEDGLRFELARTVDGDTEMDAFFEDQQLTEGDAQLHTLLAKSELWDVYRLRAFTILQQRVFDQLQVLYTTQDAVDAAPHENGTRIRDSIHQNVIDLRRLEFNFMERAYEVFENQKIELANSPVVVRYLGHVTQEPQPGPDSTPEDFSGANTVPHYR